jgi:hypothetical protein
MITRVWSSATGLCQLYHNANVLAHGTSRLRTCCRLCDRSCPPISLTHPLTCSSIHPLADRSCVRAHTHTRSHCLLAHSLTRSFFIFHEHCHAHNDSQLCVHREGAAASQAHGDNCTIAHALSRVVWSGEAAEAGPVTVFTASQSPFVMSSSHDTNAHLDDSEHTWLTFVGLPRG